MWHGVAEGGRNRELGGLRMCWLSVGTWPFHPLRTRKYPIDPPSSHPPNTQIHATARSEGHLQRKARRREVIKTKREAIRARQLEERAQRKALMRRVMAEHEEAREQDASPPLSPPPSGRPSAAHAAG